MWFVIPLDWLRGWIGKSAAKEREMLNRRNFMAVCSGLGLAGTLFPGALLALAQEKEKMAVKVGQLVAVGALAFTEPDWLDKPKVGDWVLYDRYAGSYVNGVDGEEYRIMNDKEIGALWQKK